MTTNCFVTLKLGIRIQFPGDWYKKKDNITVIATENVKKQTVSLSSKLIYNFIVVCLFW